MRRAFSIGVVLLSVIPSVAWSAEGGAHDHVALFVGWIDGGAVVWIVGVAIGYEF